MYLAVVVAIIGQALIFAQPKLLVYVAGAFAAMAAFAHWYEEPQLAARYGAQYNAYRQRVSAWIPHRADRRKVTPQPSFRQVGIERVMRDENAATDDRSR